jgi:hypothetical protein
MRYKTWSELIRIMCAFCTLFDYSCKYLVAALENLSVICMLQISPYCTVNLRAGHQKDVAQPSVMVAAPMSR